VDQQNQAAAKAKSSSTGMANIRYGVNHQPGPYAGQTVGEVRKQLGRLWSIDTDAAAYKGKTKLDENYEIQPGETIQFHKKAGEKGLA